MAWNSSTLRDVYEARLESYSCFVLEGSGSGYDHSVSVLLQVVFFCCY